MNAIETDAKKRLLAQKYANNKIFNQSGTTIITACLGKSCEFIINGIFLGQLSFLQQSLGVCFVRGFYQNKPL